ncbi:MAG: ribosome silencing factor [Alphaproteobacteria bacterium]|nr:ribosome silencing factor [Alphaproteobacteria bacterium]
MAEETKKKTVKTSTAKKTTTKKVASEKKTCKTTAKKATTKAVAKKSEAKTTTKKKVVKSGAKANAMTDLIKKIIEDGKGEKVVVLDLVGKSSLADYIVVATGRAPRHVCALAEQVQLVLKKTGISSQIEGEDVGDWVIVDAGDVIIHIFTEEKRDMYRIEELWS